MSRILRNTAVALGIVVVVSALAAPASAGCNKGICASGKDDGRLIHVRFWHTLKGNVTHFNVVGGERTQTEVRTGYFTLAAHRGKRQFYSIQACQRGGLLQSSTCGPWVRFHHDTPG
jgi:hypothetical protein